MDWILAYDMSVDINVRETIQKINIQGEVLFDVPLSEHTTIKIGGSAAGYVLPESISDLMKLIPFLTKEQLPYRIIGAGSNILVADEGFTGCVIDVKRLNHLSIRGIYVCAEVGIRMEKLIHTTTSFLLSGLEYLSGIPGTLGGAIMCNSGSFGHEISSLIEWADFIGPDGEFHRFHQGDAPFSYRTSPFPAGAVLTEAALRLSPGRSSEMLSRISRARKEREKRGHYTHPSAGSVFKNPQSLEISAGELIAQVGLKGYAIGGAAVSKKHGNIIVNTGKATADDVKALIEYIQEKVREETGIQLEREVVYLE